MSSVRQSQQTRTWWTRAGRAGAFLLAGTSIGSLLAEFYGLGSMRNWVCWLLMPACVFLVILSGRDWRQNDRLFARRVLLGAIGGLAAAIAYDIFRVPFVWANEWHLAPWLPALNLFKVFPRFGAMILGQPVEQASYSMTAQVLGWGYHFSNGATFGVMYVAVLGRPTQRHWTWAIAMAVGLECAMLLSPYPGIFAIPVTATFISVTLVAHLIFGVVLGLFCQRFSAGTSWPLQRLPDNRRVPETSV